jgi:hypothetical protein
MAGDLERNISLKQAVFESLSAVLSVDQNARLAGEEQVKTLEVTEGLSAIVDVTGGLVGVPKSNHH